MEKEISEAKWYMIHTYSGYEKKVAEDIMRMAANSSEEMRECILDAKFPTEEVVEVKNGKQRVIQRRKFPCYVMVKMVMNDKTRYAIRNIRGVTGFVGMDNVPVPLTQEEVATMGIEHVFIELDIAIGETVCIIEGPFSGFYGVVIGINSETQTLTLKIDFMSKEVSAELDFFQVKKLT